ncbi:MAG: serine hydrolase [Gemmatimonadetes bacterium]|nr:serine hydrolase [Gemmatimonadota bacterium]
MRAFIACLIVLAACSRDDRFAGLQEAIVERETRVPGAVVGVYLRDLADDATLEHRGDSLFHAASTMKLPLLVEYVRAVQAGRIDTNATLRLENRFASVVDGSPFTLDPGDDSDSTLYARVGQDVPLRELAERMITRSSNLATNALIGVLGADRAQATVRSLGANTMVVARGVEDGKAFDAGIINRTSARDLGILLEAIVSDRAAAPEWTRAMLDILERQEFSAEIPAGLPSGTRVAHKTGWITGVLHDAALIFPPGGRPPFILVVLTRGIPDQAVARALIQDIARACWDALVSPVS